MELAFAAPEFLLPCHRLMQAWYIMSNCIIVSYCCYTVPFKQIIPNSQVFGETESN